MQRSDLEHSWSITRRHLSTALGYLPPNPAGGDDGWSLSRYQEWLQHNELELALDELAGLGEANMAPEAFWKELIAAADNMGLKDMAETFKNFL
jgi:hypothetical protein